MLSFFKLISIKLLLLIFYDDDDEWNVHSSFYLKGMYTFINQGCIKSIKCDSKDIYNVIKDVLFNFLFICESWKI